VSGPFTAACIQLTAGPDLAPNIAEACERIREARAAGADVVLTPENTTMIEPRRALLLEKALPEAGHPAIPAFAGLAAELGIWLLIGSLAVRVEPTRCANRSYLFDPGGRIAARYDKIHMFDVDLASGERYRESANFRPGGAAVFADLPWGRLGLTICYDLRFPQLYRALAQAGADFICVPSAFTRPTGEAHWQVLLRARAIETGCYVLAPAQCGEHAEGRKTWGHSLIVSPWGEIVAAAGDAPAIITARIDPAAVAAARRMIPALAHDRPIEPPVGGTARRLAGE
jgi:deaminated glutathione amidase